VTVDVVTITSIIGAMIGLVTFLLKILIASKNDHIKTLEYELRDVTSERDLFRSIAMMPHDRD
jgi:hypothetical protein